MIVTRDRVWIGNRIYWTLTLVTTNHYGCLTELHTQKITVTTAHKVFSVFTSRCLVAAYKGERSSSSGFPNSLRPQLPASRFSQLQLSTDSTRSQSYLTTRGQSASLSWCQAPIWGPRPDFYYCQLRICWCGAPSLTRGRVCCLQLLLSLASAVILGSESRGIHYHI
jgi:hypothetical protein